MRARPRFARSRPFAAATVWLAVAQVIARAQSAVVLVVTARVLTEGEFAALLTAQSVLMLCATLWDFGTTSLLMREVAVGSLTPARAVAATMRLRLLTFPVFAAGIAVLLLGSDSTAHLSLLALVLLSGGTCLAALYTVWNATLIGSGEFRRLARLGAVNRCVVSLALLALLVLPLPEDTPVLIATVLLLGEGLVFLRLRRAALARARGSAAGDPVTAAQVARRSLPYALNSVFNYAYTKADVLLVAAFAGIGAVSAYGPGSQLQNLLAFAPALVVGALVPTASARPDDAVAVARLRKLVGALLVAMAAGGVLAAGLLTLVMPALLRVMVGDLAAPAVVPATILAWSLPFLCVQVTISQALVALGRPARVTGAFLAGFVVSLALHAVLAPRYGATGGAWASLARDPVVAAVLVVQYLRLSRSGPRAPEPEPAAPVRIGG